MSNETIRIRTTPNGNDKTISMQIEQKFDYIEILSLTISQEDVYRRYCSDYGVVVGRVTVNNGFGVPNARVSIFIPLSDEDSLNPELSGLYPYKSTLDKNHLGLKYNLLPKNNESSDVCFTPVGSFLSKREIQDNDLALEVYDKYYKYTTVTNAAGDYMFFGLPLGDYEIHVSADLSDLGSVSVKPYDLVRNGSNSGQFYSSSKFKESKNLETLSQIKTRGGNVNVIPFWGDLEECIIGISRNDIDLGIEIEPQAIFMGSIFSDNEKNSINKRCRPRKKMGTMENMTTGSGTIEMIRKTDLGLTEFFDIDGGELIDDNGVWAYQIPMNLDYVYTDEFGNLIPTDDPNKGIPTRARVRFKIGMNDTGNEGRLRTRAKYLVPHNPDNYNDSDYSFDENTIDKHFQDLHWNKIYTVSNHITRVQNKITGGATNHRTFVGIKEVDNGSNNPFPFNKMDVKLNPLFVILCLLVKLLAILIKLINKFIIPSINGVFSFLNKFVLKPICKLLNWIVRTVCALSNIGNSDAKNRCIDRRSISDCEIKYIPFILNSCSADESGKPYCIGCDKKNTSERFKNTFKATNESEEGKGGYLYPSSNKYNAWEMTSPSGDAGWSNCISLAIAEALDVFKFDFFSDWVNGSLYSFLLKYKVRRRGKGKEKFCEIDCETSSGVDNNKDGEADNNCFTNYVIDTCVSAKPQNSPLSILGVIFKSNQLGETYNSIQIKEGIIKKFKGELYYAAYSRTSNSRLYATKLTCLGSVFDCDWQGIPKIHDLLIDTTYNRPTLVNIYHDEGDYIGDVMESGFDSPDNKLSNAQICNINCTSLQLGSQQCNNIKRVCELGVSADEDKRDDGGLKADFIINNGDVSNAFVRGALMYVNGIFNLKLPNKVQLGFFDKDTSPKNTYEYNNEYYSKYRGIRNQNESIWHYSNSLYYYFGLVQGSTALNKLKSKYFPPCPENKKTEMSIIINEITDDTVTGDGVGMINYTIVGGVKPYRYEIEGPLINGVRYYCCYDESTGKPCNNSKNNCSIKGLLKDLFGGTYTIKISDSVGEVTSNIVVVGGFIGVECQAQPRPVTSSGSGKVKLFISHGTAPYNVEIYKLDANDEIILSSKKTLPPLYSSAIPANGYCYGSCKLNDDGRNSSEELLEGNYIVKVIDSGSKIKTEVTSKFTIVKPENIIIDLLHSSTPSEDAPNIIPKLTCYGANDGFAGPSIEGGVKPYTYEYKLLNTTNPMYYDLKNKIISTVSSPQNLVAGTYSFKVTDLGGNESTTNFTIFEPKEIKVRVLKMLPSSFPDVDNGYLKIRIEGDYPPFTCEIDGESYISRIVQNSGDEIEALGLYSGCKSVNKQWVCKPYNIRVTDASGCTNTYIYDVNNNRLPNNEFTITQYTDAGAKTPLGIFNNTPYDGELSRCQGYQKYINTTTNQPARFCFINNDVGNGLVSIAVYRQTIEIYGSAWNSGDGFYKLRINGLPNGSSNDDKLFWVMHPDNKLDKFSKLYGGGWIGLDNSNSADLGWGRQVTIFSSRKNPSTGDWIANTDFTYEISDRHQKGSFNIMNCYRVLDPNETWSALGDDNVKGFGNYSNRSGYYHFINANDSNILVGEPNSPIYQINSDPNTEGVGK
jgi:hypothetical protein